MNINIADNIKRLRSKQGITQEKLADFIGVSSQAVSKWERGDGLPDITMLPPIANFFGVTLDELMGMNELRNKDKLNEMMEKHHELRSAGKADEDVALLKEALKMFPNEYKIMAELAEYLPDHEEALKLTERILEFCTDNEIRDYAAYQECSLLFMLGRKDEALAKTKKLPGMEYCRELNIPHLLHGEERAIQCQKTIRLLGWAFFGQIEQLEDSGVFSFDERLAIYQKAIDMYNVIYDAGDMCYTHLRVYRCYFHMGGLCLENELTDRAAVYFEKAAIHANAFDKLPEKVQFTSLLLNRINFDRLKTGKGDEQSLRCEMLDGLGKYSEIIKDNNKFNAILDMLR